MSGVRASVVITYFDEAEFIDAAVASALDQSFDGAYEVILIDDGGERPVSDVLAAELRRNPILHVIRQPNQGLAAARHAGVERAQGHWVAFLDADDRMAPDKLARQVAAAEALDDPKAVIFTGTEQRPEGNLKYCHLTGDCVEIADDILHSHVPSGASMLLTREFYFDCGGFDGAIRKEAEFLLLARLIAAEARFYVIPEPLYIQTMRGDSQRHDIAERLDNIDRILNEIGDLFDHHGMKERLPDFCRRRLLAQIRVSLEDRHYAYSVRLVGLFRRHEVISAHWEVLILAYVAANAATLSLVNALLWTLIRKLRAWTRPRLSRR